MPSPSPSQPHSAGPPTLHRLQSHSPVHLLRLHGCVSNHGNVSLRRELTSISRRRAFAHTHMLLAPTRVPHCFPAGLRSLRARACACAVRHVQCAPHPADRIAIPAIVSIPVLLIHPSIHTFIELIDASQRCAPLTPPPISIAAWTRCDPISQGTARGVL